MDPQQRVLLECAWEALEDAGIDPLSLRGSVTGVFAGVYGRTTDRSAGELGDAGLLPDGHVTERRLRSRRLRARVRGAGGVDRYGVLDVAGVAPPGAQALRHGECSLALAGGVCVLGTPGIFVEFSVRAVCRPTVAVAPSAPAPTAPGSPRAWACWRSRRFPSRRPGARVLAVIRGSAMNQDGASNGLAAPSGLSQERVIRQALASAGLEPADLDAVEGHGTGTELGDPIEAQALIEAYGRTGPTGRSGSAR